MRPSSTSVIVMESNIYLTPSTRPPRRKSPVFFLLILTSFANIAIFVLGISRLGKELRSQTLETAKPFKLVSIAYSLLASIFTTVFLTITTAFFKAVYPPQNPVSSGFRELRLGEKANIVGNFTSALIWIAALGLMIAELWELGRIADDRKGDEKRLAQSVESDERLWARMGLTVFVMLGLLVLGWYSMQRVWRRDRHGNLSDSRVEMLGRW